MRNNGLFSTLFIENLKERVTLDDAAQGRMATLAQTWHARKDQDAESLWESFLKKALGYLEFVPSGRPIAPCVYPLYEDWGFTECVSVLYLAPPGSDIDDTSVGRFYPAKLLANLKERKLSRGILTDGYCWRLYSTKSSRPYEDYVELPLAETLEGSDEAEYGLFERFFHRDVFVNDECGMMGYNGGLFDDEDEPFLGRHQLRNDFLSRALYLLAFVEPFDSEPDGEYPIPYEDLEVRHLGELHETILEYTVQLADADRIRRRTKRGSSHS